MLDLGQFVVVEEGDGISLRYWVVDRDPTQTVTLYRLDGEVYVEHVKMPLDWLLNQPAADLLG